MQMVLAEAKGVRENLINILSEERSATAKKIYFSLRRRYGASATYQAVHKLLKKMLAEGVVVKEGKEYRLNPEWIKEVKRFSERLEMFHEGRMHSIPLEDGSVTFATLKELSDAVSELIETSPSREFAARLEHAWPSLGTGKSVYVLYSSKGRADRKAAERLRLGGISIKPAAESQPWDVITDGEYIIQIHLPEDIKGALNEASSADMYESLLGRKSQIGVIVNSNRQAAGQLLESVKRRFQKEIEPYGKREYKSLKSLAGFFEGVAESREGLLCMSLRHLWLPLASSLPGSRDCLVAVRSGSPADLELARRSKAGARVLNTTGSIDYAVYGDYVFYISYPKGLAKSMDKWFSRNDKVRILSVLKEEAGIKVRVTKSSFLAEQLRQAVLKNF